MVSLVFEVHPKINGHGNSEGWIVRRKDVFVSECEETSPFMIRYQC